MTRRLIVNADDCNLTKGVTCAVIDCHQKGIVTSTTFMINLPIHSQDVRVLKKQKKLGIGLHLNITLGEPVLKLKKNHPLIQSSGAFKKLKAQTKNLSRKKIIFDEYEAQVRLFKKVFGRLPTHLDTHHHLHDQAAIGKLVVKLARKYRLPVRRSSYVHKPKVRTSETFLGALQPKNHWRRKPLERALRNLPEGVSEIMCHPGVNDRDLKEISSFQKGRTIERRIFRCSGLKRYVQKKGIKLIHYGML